MFKTIDLLGMLGPVKNAWLRLNRMIQTDIEHAPVTNNSAQTALARGEIVYGVAGAKRVALARANAAATAEWVGVIAEPIVASGTGIMRHSGYAYVKFETGLTLTSGTPAYLSSATAGVATNVVPVAPGAYVAKLGIIADTTGFHTDNNPYAWVVLGNCCIDSRVR